VKSRARSRETDRYCNSQCLQVFVFHESNPLSPASGILYDSPVLAKHLNLEIASIIPINHIRLVCILQTKTKKLPQILEKYQQRSVQPGC
jgi:hypothetical protein